MDATAFYNMFREKPEVLSELIEALKRIEKENAFPKNGDKFYFFDITGEIRTGTWEDSSRQRYMKSHGNCFANEGDAANTAATVRIRKKFQNMGRAFRPGEPNWHAAYSPRCDEVLAIDTDLAVEGPYFSSKAECINAVEAIGGKEIFVAYILGSDN